MIGLMIYIFGILLFWPGYTTYNYCKKNDLPKRTDHRFEYLTFILLNVIYIVFNLGLLVKMIYESRT